MSELKSALETLMNQEWSKAREFGEALENGTTDAQRIATLEAKLAKAREDIEMALACTPSITSYVDVNGAEELEIEYDCGDPWEILRNAIKEIDNDG